MSLTTCLKNAKSDITAGDKNAIIEIAKNLRQSGLSAAEAATAAMDAQIASLQKELASVLQPPSPVTVQAPAPAIKADPAPLPSSPPSTPRAQTVPRIQQARAASATAPATPNATARQAVIRAAEKASPGRPVSAAPSQTLATINRPAPAPRAPAPFKQSSTKPPAPPRPPILPPAPPPAPPPPAPPPPAQPSNALAPQGPTISLNPFNWRDPLGRWSVQPSQVIYDKVSAFINAKVLRPAKLNYMPAGMRQAFRKMNNSINDSQETAVKLSVSLKSLSPDERLLLSDIIDKEIATGVIPPDHLLQHASQISALMTAQSDELVRLKMLTPESADRLRGQYLPRFYTSKLRQSLKGIVTNPWQVAVQRATARPSGLRGIRGSNLQNRGMTQVITTTDVDKWVALGWSSQSTNAAAHTTTVWRDFTRPEREKMGELRDALYRVVVGYTTIQKDIALGTMFQSISQRSDLSSATNVGHEDWVQVPLTEIADTAGVRSYGALAGMFVSPDVFNHLTKHTAATGVVMQTYKRLYALWKSGLTAKNPVAHGNNVMGNTMMAHFAGVSLWDGHKYAGALLDFVTSPPMMDEARQAGLFAGSISQAELLSSMPAELKALAAKQDNVIVQSAEFAQNVLTFFLGRPLSAAYQFEDAFFSYLIYRDARKRGLSPDDSVSYAQKYIFTYDDLPPTAEKIRDYALPFFSWTYKAIPALIHTAAVYPHRFIFPGAVLHGVSALMYAMAAGSDDETISQVITDYVTNERRRVAADAIKAQDQAALPPYLRGISTVLGTPKAVRIGMDVVTSLPLFWDITRIAPGGTLFDTDNNAGGIDFPQALTPSHPLFTSLVAMLGNKDMFNGKEIVLGSDTGDEKTDKRLLWLWRAFAPAIAIGNAHSERVANAIASITGEPVTWYPRDATGIDKTGAVVTPGRVAARLVGIKIQPVDIDMATIIEDSQKKKLLMQISAEIRRIERLTQAGAVSDKNADTEIDAQRAKQRSLKQGLTVEGGPTVD